MKINRKKFFAKIKGPLFGGRFTQEQVDGIDALLDEIDKLPMALGHIGNVFSQVYHETGRRMGPVREGFAKSDLGARRAVASLFAAGKISRNYALPHKNGNSYYGRGPIQTTHGDNYKKISKLIGYDVYADPDALLKQPYAAKSAVLGMWHGTYTGKGLKDYSPDDHYNMREIVNGDKDYRDKKTGERMGHKIARYAHEFIEAIEFEKPEPLVEVPPEPETPLPPVAEVPVDKPGQWGYAPKTWVERLRFWLFSLFG